MSDLKHLRALCHVWVPVFSVVSTNNKLSFCMGGTRLAKSPLLPGFLARCPTVETPLLLDSFRRRPTRNQQSKRGRLDSTPGFDCTPADWHGVQTTIHRQRNLIWVPDPLFGFRVNLQGQRNMTREEQAWHACCFLLDGCKGKPKGHHQTKAVYFDTRY